MTTLLARSLLALALGQSAAQQQAILRDGHRVSGSLVWQSGQLRFLAGTKALPLTELHSVRLSDELCPVPRVPLTHRLSLDEGQSISGRLVELTADKVKFRLFTGQDVQVERSRVRALSHPQGWHLLVHEDFEADMPTWTFTGPNTPAFDAPFSGSRSLKLAGSKHKAVMKSPGRVSSGRLLFFFRADAKTQPALIEATFRHDDDSHTARLRIDETYRVPEELVSLPASPGWHQAYLDFDKDSLKIAVDNHVLATKTMDRKARLESISFEIEGDAGLPFLLDDVMLLRPDRGKVPDALADVDTVCLANGDRLFGKIAHADTRSVVLDARFGTRTHAWYALQHFVLSPPHKQGAIEKPKEGVAVWLTPAPGFAAERLLVRVVGLEKRTLALEHEILGRIDVSLENCRRIDVNNETSPRSLVGSVEQ